MPEIRLLTAFGTVPPEAQEGIRRLIQEALETIAREAGGVQQAKAVFTESDEQCVFTVEVDGRKASGPLVLELDRVEDAVAGAPARALLLEDLRAYVRKVRG
jgi:hypothetical protein